MTKKPKSRFKKPVIGLGVFVIAGLVIGYAFSQWHSGQPTPTPYATSTTTPSPASVEPAWSDNRAIEVISPLAGATIRSGANVTGMAQVFEGQFLYRLKDSHGAVITSGTAHVSGDSSQLSPFSFQLAFNDGSGNATLEVYNLSAKDGSEIDLVTVKVILAH